MKTNNKNDDDHEYDDNDDDDNDATMDCAFSRMFICQPNFFS